MSTSKGRTGRGKRANASDFEDWLQDTFAAKGSFTALILLVKISEPEITPLASTFLNVLGDDVTWPQMAALLAGSGHPWDGAAFVPVDGPLPNPDARSQLRALEARVREDRLVLNEGQLFDLWGRRLKVEEAPLH